MLIGGVHHGVWRVAFEVEALMVLVFTKMIKSSLMLRLCCLCCLRPGEAHPVERHHHGPAQPQVVLQRQPGPGHLPRLRLTPHLSASSAS